MTGERRIGLLFGGKSGEHEVSIISARAIAAGLEENPENHVLPFYIDKQGKWHDPHFSTTILAGAPIPHPSAESFSFQLPIEIDGVEVWFPVLHGPNGEDGTVQGLLQLTQKPFVGNGVLASAVGMDKLVMKSLFAQAGLAQVKYIALNRWQWQKNPATWLEHIGLELAYPAFVKPVNLGSSVGISKVRTPHELERAIHHAFSYDDRILIEEGVTAREIECAVLGNDHPVASTVGEIFYTSDFYDYETKYTPGRATLQIPADLPAEVITAVQDLSLRAFQTVVASGLARVDFFYIPKSATILINEINTMPGFTTTSMYPKLWEASGVPFAALCDRLVSLAYDRFSAK